MLIENEHADEVIKSLSSSDNWIRLPVKEKSFKLAGEEVYIYFKKERGRIYLTCLSKDKAFAVISFKELFEIASSKGDKCLAYHLDLKNI